MTQQPIHPLFYYLVRIFTVLGKGLIVIAKILGVSLGMMLFGYSLGLLIEFLPGASIALNNGFYHLGINTQFKFAEIGMAIGFVFGLIISGTIASMKIFFTVSSIVREDTPTVAPTRTIILEEISVNMETVTPVMEATLEAADISTVRQLAAMTQDELVKVLEIPPKFAEIILHEAKDLLLQKIGT